jgi:hypothetical protein
MIDSKCCDACDSERSGKRGSKRRVASVSIRPLKLPMSFPLPIESQRKPLWKAQALIKDSVASLCFWVGLVLSQNYPYSWKFVEKLRRRGYARQSIEKL